MKKTDEHTENKPNWRAEIGEQYYYIVSNYFGEFLVSVAFDYYHRDNQRYYNSGNYFRTEKEAKKYIGIIKDLLINRK